MGPTSFKVKSNTLRFLTPTLSPPHEHHVSEFTSFKGREIPPQSSHRGFFPPSRKNLISAFDTRGHRRKRYKIRRKNPFFPIPPWEKINLGQKQKKKKRKNFPRDLGWIRTRSLQNNTTLDLPARPPPAPAMLHPPVTFHPFHSDDGNEVDSSFPIFLYICFFVRVLCMPLLLFGFFFWLFL